MAKTTKPRPWTKEDVRTLKTLAREKTKTTVIARKLKRSVGATYRKAGLLGVTLGGGRKRTGKVMHVRARELFASLFRREFLLIVEQVGGALTDRSSMPCATTACTLLHLDPQRSEIS